MKKIIVPRNIKIKQALKLLNQTGLKCLIVVNPKKDNLYLGTLTDGDIR